MVFDSPGGNGLLLSGYVRGAVVERSEFKWVGDSAIVLLGRTKPVQPCNGSNGEQPRGTQIVGNFIHEVGIWGKQGCGVFQALTMGTNISHTIVFNGPRAGVLWNDGMGGANNLEHSLMFNLVRETTGKLQIHCIDLNANAVSLNVVGSVFVATNSTEQTTAHS
eukprot:SAG31_NODE_3254_length_4489_cov_1.441002_3_plen_164_part_00